QAEDGIRDFHVTGVQTCALPIWSARRRYFRLQNCRHWIDRRRQRRLRCQLRRNHWAMRRPSQYRRRADHLSSKLPPLGPKPRRAPPKRSNSPATAKAPTGEKECYCLTSLRIDPIDAASAAGDRNIELAIGILAKARDPIENAIGIKDVLNHGGVTSLTAVPGDGPNVVAVVVG